MKVKAMMLACALLTGNVWATDKETANPVTQEGVVKITWQEPKQYSDIKAASDIQSRYEKRVFKSITDNLNKLAKKVLTHGETLELTVTNLDLAGDVRPTFGATANDLRVLKDIYPPKMDFSYQVTKGQQVIMSGDAKLKDLNYLHGIASPRQSSFYYENQMVKHWFNKTIVPRMEGTPPK